MWKGVQTATKTMGEHVRDPWKKLFEDKVFGIAPQGVHKVGPSGTGSWAVRVNEMFGMDV